MSFTTGFVTILMALVLFCASIARATPVSPVVQWMGTDLKGGASHLFSTTHDDELFVNYVYAKPTGATSSMSVEFTLGRLPEKPVKLYIKGCDDDGAAKCPVKFSINDAVIYDRPSKFRDNVFEVRSFTIPADCLKTGVNTLTIENTAPTGPIGNVPWFMVARCAIAPEGFEFHDDLSRDFFVTLPTDHQQIPVPLADGQKPGFEYRGMKGWLWKADQYVKIIPFMAKYKMNFLMNCYGSMCDVEHYAWGDPAVNRWYEPLADQKRKDYEQIVKQCQKAGIEFCFSMNPNLCSGKPLQYSSEADLEALWKHYQWMQSLGVKWFNISLDDITNGIDPAGQSRVVNEIYRRLRQNDPEAHMIFCPTIYWGDGSSEADAAYLDVVKKQLHPDVYIFWTGDSVVGQITTAAANRYQAAVGHKLFLWDNYPVNDGQPTLHLGPVINRDPDLCSVITGYVANPMHTEDDSNRIPLLTAVDYAYNPDQYDPKRSIGQAIVNLETNPDKQKLLKDLVEHYPGFIIWGKPSTGLNPVREQLHRIIAQGHSRYLAEALLADMEKLGKRLNKAYPKSYRAERARVQDDIAYIRTKITERYGVK